MGIKHIPFGSSVRGTTPQPSRSTVTQPSQGDGDDAETSSNARIQVQSTDATVAQPLKGNDKEAVPTSV